MSQISRSDKIRVPVILGPTAAGKTACAIALARTFGCEVLSCDSRQIYRGMDIGTAKPSLREREEVVHWMIDIVDPSEAFSAFRFAQTALDIIRQRARDGVPVLVCGGTGFYFQALSRGLCPIPSNSVVRARFQSLLQEQGPDSIFKELASVDPESASRIHPGSVRRAIRALEVFHTSGRRFSELGDSTHPPPDLEFFVLSLTVPRPLLYERINDRVDRMIEQGLWDEFSRLCSSGYLSSTPGLQCVGYRELFDVYEARATLRQAIESIKTNSRRYAKRQITWIRHQTAAVEIESSEKGYALAEEQVERFLKHGK